MSRFRLLAALVVLTGAVSAASLAAPACVLACSCAQPPPIDEFAGDPGAVVMAGIVTAVGPDQRGSFQVDAWFRGEGAARLVPIRGGNGADCGIPLSTGQRLILVASWSDGILQSSICSPFADLATPEGLRLLREAEAAFGPGIEPEPGGPDGEAAPGGPDPFVILLGGGLVLLAVLSILAFARPDRLSSPGA